MKIKLVCVDIGNTNIKFGIFQGGVLIEKFIISTCFDQEDLEQLFEKKIEKNSRVVIAGMNESIVQLVSQVGEKITGCRPIVLTTAMDFGFVINYDLQEIGIDRLLNLVGAKEIFSKKNILLIDFGTAVSIDFFYKNNFQGGVILPGLRAMATVLTATTKIKYEGFGKPKFKIGQNTNDAVNAGVYFSILNTVKDYVNYYRDDTGREIKIVLTGGDSAIFVQDLQPDFVEENITLFGILEVYRKNCKL
jgi:type III pantothenate kinase